MAKADSKPTPEDERFLKGLTKKQQRRRKRDLGAIHAGKRDLGLSETEYRDLLEAWTGRRSAKYMRAAERGTVLDNFRAMGFAKGADQSAKKAPPAARRQPKRKLPPEAADPSAVERPQHQKIVHLWHALFRQGKIHNPDLGALCKFVERQTGIQHVRWLPTREANTVIESLKKWLAREEKTRN